jgi:imidazolonepropionase
MLKYGTTSLEAKTGYGLTVSDEIKSLEAIGELKKSTCQDIIPTFMGAHAVPPEYKNPDDYVDLIIIEMLPAIRKKAVFCDVFCEKDVFTIDQANRILRHARDDGLGLKLHADEFGDNGGASLAAEVRAVSADHLLYSNREDLKKMVDRGVIGVLLPVSAFTMMSGKYADARGMIDAGLPIALGTDLCPNSLTESMQFVISLACYNMRMTPAEAVCAATINSAYAIGLGITHGSLEPGKAADILIVDAPNHLHLAYHMGVNLVEKVIKNGNIVA